MIIEVSETWRGRGRGGWAMQASAQARATATAAMRLCPTSARVRRRADADARNIDAMARASRRYIASARPPAEGVDSAAPRRYLWRMKIATWKSILVKARLPLLTRWLTSSSPTGPAPGDSNAWQRLAAARDQGAGYQRELIGQKKIQRRRRAGAASHERCAARPPEAAGIDKAPDSRRAISRSTWQACACLVYMTQRNPAVARTSPLQARWMEKLCEHRRDRCWRARCRSCSARLTTLQTDDDVYNPKRLARDDAVPAGLARALPAPGQSRLTDAFLRSSRGRTATAWDYRPALAPRRGLRIDHMLLSPQLAGPDMTGGGHRQDPARLGPRVRPHAGVVRARAGAGTGGDFREAA